MAKTLRGNYGSFTNLQSIRFVHFVVNVLECSVAALYGESLPAWLRYVSVALFFTFSSFTLSAAADETIVLSIHQSVIVNLPGDLPGEHCGTKTIVLGDPLIADIAPLSSTSGNLFVSIIGKGHGATSLVAFDCKGIELAKKIIEVTGPEI
jgi:Flp pilus assembly secretin CpaC